jgi:hypothetical protein
LDYEPDEPITVSGAGSIAQQSSVTISTQTSYPTLNFVHWYNNTDSIIASTEANYTFTMPSNNLSLTAVYEYAELPSFTMTAVGETGIVSTTGSGVYQQGETVALDIVLEDSNYAFVRWEDENGITVSTSSVYVFDMPSYDYTVYAITVNNLLQT